MGLLFVAVMIVVESFLPESVGKKTAGAVKSAIKFVDRFWWQAAILLIASILVISVITSPTCQALGHKLAGGAGYIYTRHLQVIIDAGIVLAIMGFVLSSPIRRAKTVGTASFAWDMFVDHWG